MKLVALLLFAVCCCASVSAATRPIQTRKLKEVLRQLNEVKESLQQNEKMLNTPPENVEDCCCLPALECFRANLRVHFNVTEKKQSKLYKSLSNRITLDGVNFCNSGNNTSTCHDCESHPKANAKEFFNRLESLIQRAITRLIMD